ncbi:MAG: PEP-CTERM sorting domain-containing protein [Phycisphaerales bacterium]
MNPMNLIPLTATVAGLSMSAAASVVPFTETFSNDVSNWTAGSDAPLTFVESGALDGSSYATGSADLNTAGPFGLTLLRGEASTNASDGAFVGNYLTGGINRLEFDFRHDAGQDLNIALRVSTPMNFPGFAVELNESVASGEWVTLSFDLFFGNPLITFEGPPSPMAFNGVMENVGNLQISANRPDGLSTPLNINFDLDNVRIVPAPSALAMLGLGGLVATRRRR